MVNKKKKQFIYNNGYTVECPHKENEFINRKIFSKDNEGYQKVFLTQDNFANWKPTIDDIPSLLHSINFFTDLRVKDEKLNKKLIQDTQLKVFMLLMKLGEIPGVIPMKAGDEPDQLIYHATQLCKASDYRNKKSLSRGLQNLKKLLLQ